MSSLLERFKPAGSCHGASLKASGKPVIAIVGCPNVGKSVLFNRFTGAYVTVSNYPGTTVEVTRGKAKIAGIEVEVVDTPGMYSLLPISEEEAVARRLLLEEHPKLVLHIIDAKNMPRMLPMTLQLLEAGLPVALVMNMMDEADEAGFTFDAERLSEQLGIPVLSAAGATNRGVRELQQLVGSHLTHSSIPSNPLPSTAFHYDATIEEAISQLSTLMGSLFAITPRAVALLLLQQDREMLTMVAEQVSDAVMAQLNAIIADTARRYAQPLPVVITLQRQAWVTTLLSEVMNSPRITRRAHHEWLSRLLMQPLTGIPIVALVLYFGIYQFVGRFGGGTMVNFLEHQLFGHWINPWVTGLVQHLLPNPLWSNLFVGEYGLFTLGVTYSFAIVLPIVGLFFFVFSILEDSGYLPRLAMLIDRLFKVIGLNGRAVIPLVLGFGCDTMATLVTRVLETKRERFITTLLLALAIPCAAQSGLFMAMLGSIQPYGLLIYLLLLLIIFLVVGMLAARVMPGQRAQFYIELPPLRLPRLNNVLVKTYSRLEWYFVEILPSFMFASVILWLGSLAWTGHAMIFSPHHGFFGVLERGLDPLSALIGLPTSADVLRQPALEFSGGTILLAGFFRRDFGAAGLWHLFRSGLLTPVQVLVAAITLTLFLPCIAQFMVMKKERGLWPTLAMTAFILVMAFGIGYLVRIGLDASGIKLFLNKSAMPVG